MDFSSTLRQVLLVAIAVPCAIVIRRLYRGSRAGRVATTAVVVTVLAAALAVTMFGG